MDLFLPATILSVFPQAVQIGWPFNFVPDSQHQLHLTISDLPAVARQCLLRNLNLGSLRLVLQIPKGRILAREITLSSPCLSNKKHLAHTEVQGVGKGKSQRGLSTSSVYLSLDCLDVDDLFLSPKSFLLLLLLMSSLNVFPFVRLLTHD